MVLATKIVRQGWLALVSDGFTHPSRDSDSSCQMWDDEISGANQQGKGGRRKATFSFHMKWFMLTQPRFSPATAHVPYEAMTAICLANSEQEVEIQSSGTIRCMMHWRFQRGDMLHVELLPTNLARPHGKMQGAIKASNPQFCRRCNSPPKKKCELRHDSYI